MKIIDKINKAKEEGRPTWSFEYFPPKTAQGIANLYDRIERMYSLGPEFIDVTWGAGGSTSELTTEICATAQSVYGLETCMHLTCTNMHKDMIDKALKDAKNAGIQNILALRGDPPRGQDAWTATEGGFSYATDLVRYIRQQYGDYFGIAVAGYPEVHFENISREDDIRRLKEKLDAGADYVVTQLFYDVDLFLKWVKELRAIGVTAPIIPGILPIQSYGSFTRAVSMSKTFVPKNVLDALEPIKEDDQAVKDYGIRLAIEMIRRMQAEGINNFHLYTFNLERSSRLVLEGLGFIAPVETVKPLPWSPSLSKKREKENVRPIFWKNRKKSYVARTETWDDFPNGRWGDSRSPAYGELDGYGVSIKYSPQDALKMWDYPQTIEDVSNIFAKYCRGEINGLPWNDRQLNPETDIIREQLTILNTMGFLTINSQPAVNGRPSQDKTYGWGPAGGYVYQKSYLEFFVSPEQLDALLKHVAGDKMITYHAVNRQGDFRTNTRSDGPNAVTWGVFPGKEIQQPTIVEAISFMAWKDEAFELWSKWAKIYEPNSPSEQLINSIAANWYLVNVVHNDFQKHDAIFEIFGNADLTDTNYLEKQSISRSNGSVSR